MIQRRIFILVIILTFSLSLASCNDNQQSESDDLKEDFNDLMIEINHLKEEISILKDENLLLNTTAREHKIFTSNIHNLLEENKKINVELLALKEVANLNSYHEALTDLTTFESLKFEQFRLNYDDEVLLGLEPISICKMYLYASLLGDYETVYELYTTNEEYAMATKEEYLNIRNEHRMSDFTVFEDIYDLNFEVNKYNEEHAVITWHSKNGYFDENIGAYIYSFSFIKDGDIWKVSFVPMQ